MATKDGLLLLSSKQKSVANIDKYSNFNLNQGHQCSTVSSFQSNSKSLKNNKFLGKLKSCSHSPIKKRIQSSLQKKVVILTKIDYSNKGQNADSKIVEKDKEYSKGNKSSSNNSKPFNYLHKFDGPETEAAKKRWKVDSTSANNPTSSSTLSLHIAAYENSVEEDTVSLIENNALKKKDFVEKRKQIYPNPTLLGQNSFEFPRQQEDDLSEPEVMQYSASQHLLTPNQLAGPNVHQYGIQNAAGLQHIYPHHRPRIQRSENFDAEFGIEYVKDVAEAYGIGLISEATANTISTHVNCLIRLLLISARDNRIASGRENFDIGDIHIAAKELGLNLSSTFWNVNRNGNALIKPAEHLADSVMNNKIFGDIVIYPNWLVIEGEHPIAHENLIPTFNRLDLASAVGRGSSKKEDPYELFEEAWKAKPKIEACVVKTKLIHSTSIEQEQLFKEITEIMVCGDDAKQQKAMSILREDPSIQVLVPRFISFVANGIKVNIAEETLVMLIYFLLIVESLLENPYIDMEEDLHVLLPSLISCILIRSKNFDNEGSYGMRKLSANILFKLFNRYHIPYAQHRVLNILSKSCLHLRTSIPTLVAVIHCLKLFGPEYFELYFFRHLPKVKELIGNYKPPKEIVEKDNSNKKQDFTKLGDAIYDALFEYSRSPYMEDKSLEYCRHLFGPFGDDVYRRIIKADMNDSQNSLA